MTISTSPRRRQVVISSASRSIPRRARRSTSRRSPTPGSRTAAACAGGRRSRPAIAARNASGSHRRRATSAAARAAARAARRPSGPAGRRRRHDQPGRGADRLEHRRAGRHDRLLAVGRAAPPPSSRSGQRTCSARRISPIRSSSASSSTIGRGWNAPTTSAVRSSAVGPSPPLVTIRSTPCARQPAQRVAHVLAAGRRRRSCARGRRPARAAARTATARCGRRRGR